MSKKEPEPGEEYEAFSRIIKKKKQAAGETPPKK